MDKLGEDLFVIEILSRLPIKSLISVRRVCKPWRCCCKVAISNPNFVKLHKLRNPDDDYSNDSFIAHYYPQNEYQCHRLYALNVNFPKRPPINLNLPLPTSTKLDGFNVVGSCNGLLCLAYTSRRKKPQNSLYLWNPVTRQIKDIHNYTIKNKLGHCDVSLGFGFDHANSDYKVVRIVKEQRKANISRVEVYSLNKNVWEEIDVELKFRVLESFCVTVKGMLYWLINDPRFLFQEFGLLSFDVQSEKFHPISLPDGIWLLPNIFSLKESLAISAFHLHDESSSIWTLDDDNRTWHKMHTLPGLIRNIVGGLHTGIYVGETDNGDLLLCDPLNDSVKVIRQSPECNTPRTNYYSHQPQMCTLRTHNYSASLEIL